MKKMIKTVLVITMIACTLFSTYSFARGAALGTNRFTGTVTTRETEDFCLQTFQHATSPEQLALIVIFFALKNFTYDESYTTHPQTLDTHRFIFQNDFHGVCADFATFVNTALRVVSRHKGWEHVGSHIVTCIDPSDLSAHMLNYLSVRLPDGTVKVYEIDTTWDLGRRQASAPIQGLTNCCLAASQADVPATIGPLFSRYHSDFSIKFTI